jgi:hypothetical protein
MCNPSTQETHQYSPGKPGLYTETLTQKKKKKKKKKVLPSDRYQGAQRSFKLVKIIMSFLGGGGTGV